MLPECVPDQPAGNPADHWSNIAHRLFPCAKSSLVVISNQERSPFAGGYSLKCRLANDSLDSSNISHPSVRVRTTEKATLTRRFLFQQTLSLAGGRFTGIDLARAILHAARSCKHGPTIDPICSVQVHLEGALHGGETMKWCGTATSGHVPLVYPPDVCI